MQTFIEHTDFCWSVFRRERHFLRYVLLVFQVERQEDPETSWHVEGVRACAKDSVGDEMLLLQLAVRAAPLLITSTVASSSLVGRPFAQEQVGLLTQPSSCLHREEEHLASPLCMTRVDSCPWTPPACCFGLFFNRIFRRTSLLGWQEI